MAGAGVGREDGWRDKALLGVEDCATAYNVARKEGAALWDLRLATATAANRERWPSHSPLTDAECRREAAEQRSLAQLLVNNLCVLAVSPGPGPCQRRLVLLTCDEALEYPRLTMLTQARPEEGMVT